VAGVRTYALTGLLGGVCGLLSNLVGPVLLGFTFLGFTALVLFAYRTTAKQDNDFGMTSEVAALLVFVLGALAVLGDMAIAGSTAVVLVAILNVKRYLHDWLRHISRLELDGAIQLLIISVVILPVLPDRGFGPGEVLNPFKMWLMVVFIAALSFVGYIAIRKLGANLGILTTSLFGGLASSTAVTLSLARMGRCSPTMAPMLAAGSAAASAVMFVRVLLVASTFNAALFPALAWPLGLMSGVSVLGAILLHLRHRNKDTDATPELPNPSELGPAIQFGLLLGAVALFAYYAKLWIGDAGIYAVAATAGLADVDAITLNMAQLAGDALSVQVATNAIIIAVAVNTAVKFAIVWAIAGRALAAPLAVLSMAALTAGGLGLLI
jgi:uncharacterized membrane protein (DUF4010 family)